MENVTRHTVYHFWVNTNFLPNFARRNINQPIYTCSEEKKQRGDLGGSRKWTKDRSRSEYVRLKGDFKRLCPSTMRTKITYKKATSKLVILQVRGKGQYKNSGRNGVGDPMKRKISNAIEARGRGTEEKSCRRSGLGGKK